MNTNVLVGDLVEHWLRHAERRRTVCFAVDIDHSVDIVNQFRKSEVRAEHLSGETPQDEREAILARLTSGETEVVSNCNVLTEGYDLPDLGCITLARPTRSLGLYRQMVGRGLRTAEGKTDVIILDHSGGVHRHGRPDDPIEWTLDPDTRATNAAHEARKTATDNKDPFVECTACGHLRMRGMACDNCGWKPKPKARAVGYVDQNLIELGKANAAANCEAERLTFYRELRGFQQSARKKDGSPYAPGWAANQYRTKHGHYPPWSWNHQPPIEPSLATRRWIKSRQIAWAKRSLAG
jgi:superfamily II DNA or RNA helicase